MSSQDAAKVVSELVGAFRKDSVSQETVATYVKHLSGIDGSLLSLAVERIIGKSTFFPAIAEIKHACLAIAGLLTPTKAEGMSITHQADKRVPLLTRDGIPTGSYIESWEWPEDISPAARKACEETLARVGEPRDKDGKAYFGWDKGFEDTYELVAGEVLAENLANIHLARLPAPKEQKVLPMPKPDEPRPEDKPIPQCVICDQHIGVFETPQGVICFWCKAKAERAE